MPPGGKKASKEEETLTRIAIVNSENCAPRNELQQLRSATPAAPPPLLPALPACR